MASSSNPKAIRSPSPTGSVRSTNFTPSSSSAPMYDNNKKDDLRVEPFRGDRAKLGMFIAQLAAVFSLKRGAYPTHADKALYAALHMKDSAFHWIEPLMMDHLTSREDQKSQETKDVFSNFEVFITRLKQIFGTPGEELAATQRIHQLKQTGSAAQYFALFQRLKSKIDWEESAFVSTYYMGLKDNVKDEMGMDWPKDYQELVDESIKIDNWLYERQSEKRGYRNRTNQYFGGGGKSYAPRNRQSYGDPMDIDVMERGKPTSRNGNRGRGRGGFHGGNNRERERQRNENLCFSCGKPGHRARECKRNAQDLHMMTSGGTAGSEETKADTSDETQVATDSQGITAQKGHPESEILRGSGASKGDDGIPPTKATTALAEACQQAMAIPGLEPKYVDLIEKALRLEAIESAARSEEIRQHASKSWVGCYDDSCTIHYSDKMGSRWFPSRNKRRNRQNKKTRENQETLAEQGDLPPPGQNPVDDSFWMMDSQETDPIKFVVTRHTTTYLYMVTPYWKWVGCEWTDCLQRQDVGHQHRAFDPKGTEVKEPMEIYLAFCTDRNCPIKGLHAHQGPNTDNIAVIEVPEEMSRHAGVGPTQNLSMINDTPPEDPEEEETDSEEEELTIIPLAPGEDKRHQKVVVLRYTPYEVTIVTNYWYLKDCEDPECTVSSQHRHLVFDPTVAPKRSLKTIKFHYCMDYMCEEKENFHVHQNGDDEPIIFANPPEQIREILERRRQGNSINMMVESLGTMETTLDYRANDEHLAEYFACSDIECPEYFTAHAHLYNIDPRYPHVPIRQEAYVRMLGEGMICEEQQCQWRQQLHVHFPTQQFNMMVGNAYQPEIIENVVDERVEERFIADYFDCVTKNCTQKGFRHSHLFNIDPIFRYHAIKRESAATLEGCEDPQCEFDMWPHMHLPKNL